MKYCGQCGAPVDGAFCGNCGAATGQSAGADAAGEATQAIPTSGPAGGERPSVPVSDAGYPASAVAPQPQPDAAREPVPPEYRPTGEPEPLDTGARRRGSAAPFIAAGVVVALLLAGGGAFFFLRDGDSGSDAAKPVTTVTATVTPTGQSAPTDTPTTTSTSESSSTSSSPSATPGDPSATPTGEDDAKRKLDAWAAADSKATPPDNTWLVQLDSKYVGIKDTSQQSTDFTAVDIWNHFQQYRDQFPNYTDDLLVLRNTSFGEQTKKARNKHMWVVVLKLNFGSQADAKAWCSANFSQTGKRLANVCGARQYKSAYTS